MEGDTLRRPGDADGAGASIVSGRSDETGKVDLLDLPDDALRLVVGCIAGCVGGHRRSDHVPLLLTCRRLAAVGYSAVREVHIHSAALPFVEVDGEGDPAPDGRLSGAALLASPAGERLQRRLFSLQGFLRHAHNVCRVVLSDQVADQAVTPYGTLALDIFWGLLRGALSPLPISSLACDHSAVAALWYQRVSSVPLRCLRLGGLDARDKALRDADQHRGVLSVLGRHRPTLQELHIAVDARGATPPEGFVWSQGYLLSLLRRVVCMPALRTLWLGCYVCRETARLVAAACPLVETLVLEGGCGGLDGDTGRCWPFPRTFPQLASLSCVAGSLTGAAGSSLDLLHTLRGRRLHRLRLWRLAELAPPLRPTSDAVVGLQHVAALKSCAALPASLDLGGFGCWTRELLQRLCDDGNEVASLHDLTICVPGLEAATLAPLARLAGLIRLTLEVHERTAADHAQPGCSHPEQRTLRSSPGLGGACVDYGSSMLHTLWTSGTRLSRHALFRPKTVSASSTTEETAGRLASLLPALRHLSIGDETWSCARGRVVGRSP